MKLKKIVVVASFICLIVSLCINMYLFQQVMDQYQMLQAVRLDPATTYIYSAANARIPDTQSGVFRIIFFGDSRIAQWNPLPVVAKGQLLNRGMPGETTAQAVLRLKQDVLELKPDITVVQAGINDLKNVGLFPERKEEIVRSCRENLNAISMQLAEHDIQVVILTVFPPGSVDLFHRPLWSDDIYRGINQINEMIKGMKDPRITVVDCNAILTLGQSVKPEFAQDTYHLTTTGYEALNRSLSPVLQELVKGGLKVSNEDAVQ